jgi:hypothetical protein
MHILLTYWSFHIFVIKNLLQTTLTLSDWKVLGGHPPVEYHGGVMVYVQESHLVVLLTQDEEYLY